MFFGKQKEVIIANSQSAARSILRLQKGQIVVEYVLLLSIAVTVAMIIVSGLVKRGDSGDNSGALIQKWRDIQEAIASDMQN